MARAVARNCLIAALALLGSGAAAAFEPYPGLLPYPGLMLSRTDSARLDALSLDCVRDGDRLACHVSHIMAQPVKPRPARLHHRWVKIMSDDQSCDGTAALKRWRASLLPSFFSGNDPEKALETEARTAKQAAEQDFIKAYEAACRDPDHDSVAAFTDLLTQFDNQVCRIWTVPSRQDFELSDDQTWVSRTTPSQRCGLVTTTTLRQDPAVRSPESGHFLYETRRLATKDTTDLGEDCSFHNEAPVLYSWRPQANYRACTWLEFGAPY